MTALENLKLLSMKNVALDMIYSLGTLRNNLSKLHVLHSTNTTSICQILQCDVIHKYNLEGSEVIAFWGTKAKCICLDNERPTQAELDKVSVLQALRIVKEGKTPNLTRNFNR
ncbi:hypothetical protein NQ314_007890 [Rhamnusium bicolor]|uniref:Chemokine interleukin-8-like domain-containing protein n=1 Tax=Rhamnusium bicolor TaxID=1586634 RepID=A0AAV8YHS1_9CUCU|nr:hypothetical protein NQ314_007890 [Rhamnusium bicolor]